MKKIFLIIAITLINLVEQENADAQTLYNGIGHIPSYYQETWNIAGLLQDMSSVTPKLVIVMNPGDISS